jgi:geranylgeranyl reductase
MKLIASCRREVMDAYLRDRAEKDGAKVINGLMMRMEQPGGSRMTKPMT